MDRQMEIIIKRQQEYESMKRMPLSTILDKQNGCGISVDYLEHRVVSELRRACKNKRKEKNFQNGVAILTIVCVSFIVLLRLVLFVYLQVDMFAKDNALDETYENTPLRQAERAVESGDYDKAEKILEDILEENPDNFFAYITYADIYLAQGRNDDAVSVLVDTIYNRFHVQNMTSTRNFLYQKLKEIPEDSLEKPRQDYQSCLADCEVYIDKYEEMVSLIRQESYYYALLICDELKSEGTYDIYLYYYYAQCYNALKAYDECAEYFLGLYGKKQGITDLRHLSDEQILFYLDKIKENVSPEMAAKIEALE